MKAKGWLLRGGALFGVSLSVYIIAYIGIEHERTRRGPWQVAFTNEVSDAPVLVINQPALAINRVRIIFPGETLSPANPAATLVFDQPRPVPYDVPFGQCVFMDTTSLPGTVVLKLFGHEIQLMPRVLTVDNKERPWRSEETLALPGTNRPGRPVMR
jgi:hypothetical protein